MMLYTGLLLLLLLPEKLYASASPVVGILTQPKWSGSSPRNREHHDTYIAASYVKWLESGGARSIPIPYEADYDTIDELLLEINGVLLPGGNYELTDTVQYLLDSIAERNRAGNYFPVWGTCMGFEIMIEYGSRGALQSGFDSENITLPLEDLVSKELYVESTLVSSLQQKAITMNNHGNAIETQRFYSDVNLTSLWNVTSTNHDRQGRPFVSTIEPQNPQLFPFYAVLYHPEKNAFEQSTYPGTNIPVEVMDHSEDGILLSFTLARFFVRLARRNTEADFSGRIPLVQAYPIESGIEFEQVYLTSREPLPAGTIEGQLFYQKYPYYYACVVAMLSLFFLVLAFYVPRRHSLCRGGTKYRYNPLVDSEQHVALFRKSTVDSTP